MTKIKSSKYSNLLQVTKNTVIASIQDYMSKLEPGSSIKLGPYYIHNIGYKATFPQYAGGVQQVNKEITIESISKRYVFRTLQSEDIYLLCKLADQLDNL